MANSGRTEELGISKCSQSPEIQEIYDPSPLVTAALHRLLLAVLHPALRGPKDANEWAVLWADGEGRWDGEPSPSTWTAGGIVSISSAATDRSFRRQALCLAGLDGGIPAGWRARCPTIPQRPSLSTRSTRVPT